MATLKSYTDLEQSKKLAEILPLESADMYYFIADSLEKQEINYAVRCGTPIVKTDIPCWSLAALLSILPTIDNEFEPQLHRSSDKYICTYEGKEDSSGLWKVADNPVDACYELLLKLHEVNLL